MLGFTRCYHTFIPAYADVIRALKQLTWKSVQQIWTGQYQQAFELLKEALMKSQIFVYLDPNKPFTLFSDD